MHRRLNSIGMGVRAWWLILAFVSGFATAMWAEELMLNWRDNRLELSAPRLHFLAGKPLERLHNGADVPFNFRVTLFSGNRDHMFLQMADRFVVSYSVWEQTFQIVKMQAPHSRIEHLSAPAAEAWCLKQMPIDVTGLNGSDLIWAKVEIREDGRGAPLFGNTISESGISLTSLIELFSRPPVRRNRTGLWMQVRLRWTKFDARAGADKAAAKRTN